MANGWTAARKARQRVLIRNWRPWENSTGPKSEEGKVRSAMRGFKGATRPTLRALASVLRQQREFIEEVGEGT